MVAISWTDCSGLSSWTALITAEVEPAGGTLVRSANAREKACQVTPFGVVSWLSGDRAWRLDQWIVQAILFHIADDADDFARAAGRKR